MFCGNSSIQHRNLEGYKLRVRKFLETPETRPRVHALVEMVIYSIVGELFRQMDVVAKVDTISVRLSGRSSGRWTWWLQHFLRGAVQAKAEFGLPVRKLWKFTFFCKSCWD